MQFQKKVVYALLVCFVFSCDKGDGYYLFETTTPYIMTTWASGVNATNLAWKYLTEDELSLLDCVERGISEACELAFCAAGVGPYDKVDEKGDLSFDAMMMDGNTKVVGAVGNLRNVKAAISVARAVMKYSTHTFITGDGATQFAKEMGFPEEELRNEDTELQWQTWLNKSCQPNFRQNVEPDPLESCGPYTPGEGTDKARQQKYDYDPNHDTIGQFIIDENEEVVVGVSTNGLKHKIQGRVGDSPVPGGGGYALSGIGAAAATGNGDVMIRFLPSFESVLRLGDGYRPDLAVISTVLKMQAAFPGASAAVMVGNARGQFSAACTGYTTFPFVVRSNEMETTIIEINCEESLIPPDGATINTQNFGLMLMIALFGAVISAE